MFLNKLSFRISIFLVGICAIVGTQSIAAQTLQSHPGPEAGCAICRAYRSKLAVKQRTLRRKLSIAEQNEIIRETENRMLPTIARKRLREIEVLKSGTLSPSARIELMEEEAKLQKQLGTIETETPTDPVVEPAPVIPRKTKPLSTQRIVDLYAERQSTRSYRY